MSKPLPPSYFLLTLNAMALLHVLWPVGRYWHFPLTLGGLVPLGIGVVLNIVADRQFKRHGTTVRPFAESSTLLTAFPFSLTRNPMYLGMTAIVAGVALLFGTVLPLLPAVAFPVLMDRLFIREEERMLRDRFGANWDGYSQSVRRWL